MKMKNLISPLFLVIGTAGLLANEYVTQWGTLATLIFTGFSSIGLFLFGVDKFFSRKAVQDEDSNLV